MFLEGRLIFSREGGSHPTERKLKLLCPNGEAAVLMRPKIVELFDSSPPGMTGAAAGWLAEKKLAEEAVLDSGQRKSRQAGKSCPGHYSTMVVFWACVAVDSTKLPPLLE